MPPLLALFIVLCGIVWLLRRDMRERTGSWELLIPALWLLVQGSRPLSYWLNAGHPVIGDKPIDTLFFVGLLVAALIILAKGNFQWATFISKNKTLTILYLYFAFSMLWSEFPFTSLKRVIKDFGGVTMVLVLLASSNPVKAVKITYTRVAYVLLPLSFVLINYFPDIGRQPSRAGDNMFRGVASHKNSLGILVFVFGLILLWDLIDKLKEKPYRLQRTRIRIAFGILLLDLYLLFICNSKTALLCLVIGFFVFWATGRLAQMRNGKFILISGIISAVGLAGLDRSIGISEKIAILLGKNPDLTGRKEIWQAIFEQKPNPLTGEGFYIFWDIEKGKTVKEALVTLSSAHNGYLEVYLDGGLVAIFLLLIFLLATGKRVIDRVFVGHPLAKIGLCFWTTAILYNFSESSFFRLDLIWLMLLLVTIDVSRQRSPLKAPVENTAFINRA